MLLFTFHTGNLFLSICIRIMSKFEAISAQLYLASEEIALKFIRKFFSNLLFTTVASALKVLN